MLWVSLLIICSALQLSTSAPIPDGDGDATIVTYNNNQELDKYGFDFETSNGIKREERGKINNFGTDDEILEVEGSYSYVGPDGRQVNVKYTAGEKGYQPVLSFGELLAG